MVTIFSNNRLYRELTEVVSLQPFREVYIIKIPCSVSDPAEWVLLSLQTLPKDEPVIIIDDRIRTDFFSSQKQDITIKEDLFSLVISSPLLDHLSAGSVPLLPADIISWEQLVSEEHPVDMSEGSVYSQVIHAGSLVVFDTQVFPDISSSIAVVAENLAVSYTIIPIGTSHLVLWLTGLLFGIQSSVIGRYERSIAELSMALDLLDTLVTVTNEKEAIEKILDIYSLIMSPKVLAYYPCNDLTYGPLHCRKGDLKTYHPPEIPISSLPPKVFHDPENGRSLLVLRYRADPVGVLWLGDFAFPENQQQYLNLSFLILPLCSLAIAQSRTFSRLEKSIENLGFEINERKRVEKALRRNNRQLNLLTSITRHDILNKINAQIILCNLIINDPDSPKVKEFVENIQHAAEVIQSQIEFTSLFQELGAQDPKWQLVKNLILDSHIPKEITMTVSLPDIEVYADLLLGRVFYTFIDNAVRHGEKVTRISVGYLFSVDGELIITWEDNGTGIREDEKEMIFKRGYGKNSGLGLFFSREILTITGIRIKETGTYGQGARFELHVPKGNWRIIRDREIIDERLNLDENMRNPGGGPNDQ